MTVLRYGILLLVGIMILTGCALLAGKDQPIEQPLQSAGEQLKEKPAERPLQSVGEQLKEKPAERPLQSVGEQLKEKPAERPLQSVGEPLKDQPAEQPFQSVGDQLLVKGITNYEDGEYKSAAKNLREALKAGLSRKIDSAKAHKYLAFIACGSDNTRICRDEFRKAFEDDPNFALDASETGHPVWGPVYRRVQDQMKSKEKPR